MSAKKHRTQAEHAVMHILAEMKRDPLLAHVIGPGSLSFELLMIAGAAVSGQGIDAYRDPFMAVMKDAHQGTTIDQEAISIDMQSIIPVSWTRDDTFTFNVLLLVGGQNVPIEAIAGWTDMQCVQAEQWARALHLNASDNDEVEVPDMPAHVAAYRVERDTLTEELF